MYTATLFVLGMCFSMFHTSHGLYKPRDTETGKSAFKQHEVTGDNGKNAALRNMGAKMMVSERQEGDYVTQEQLEEVQKEINMLTTQMNTVNSHLQASFADLNDRVDGQDSSIATIQDQQADERTPPPMFFGQLSKQIYDEFGVVYKFDSVVVDQTGAYDVGSGKFTCGPTGWYFFAFSLYGAELTYTYYHDVYGDLMKGDTKITTAYSSNFIYAPIDQWMNLQASTSALIKCNTGEQVYVTGISWVGYNAKTTSGDFVAMLIHKE